MSEEERAGRGMVEFTTVVALDCLDGGAELRTHIGKKVSNGTKRVGFET
jgi:hypothetical protein